MDEGDDESAFEEAVLVRLVGCDGAPIEVCTDGPDDNGVTTVDETGVGASDVPRLAVVADVGDGVNPGTKCSGAVVGDGVDRGTKGAGVGVEREEDMDVVSVREIGKK